jgi:hypothetical protein
VKASIDFRGARPGAQTSGVDDPCLLEASTTGGSLLTALDLNQLVIIHRDRTPSMRKAQIEISIVVCLLDPLLNATSKRKRWPKISIAVVHELEGDDFLAISQSFLPGFLIPLSRIITSRRTFSATYFSYR